MLLWSGLNLQFLWKKRRARRNETMQIGIWRWPLKKWIELAPHLPHQDKSRKVFKSFATCSCDKKSHQQFCQHCQRCKVKFLFWTQCCRKWICQACTMPRNDDELVKCFICQKKKKWIETVVGKNKFRYKKLLNPYAIIRNRRISQTHSINPLDVVQVEMGEWGDKFN